MTTVGATNMRWHGENAKRRGRTGSVTGLRAAAGLVFDASQTAVPEDTGRLKQSGKVTLDEARLRAEISYGQGLPDERAVLVHEKLEIHHDNGQAKYLENPMSAMATRIRLVIAAGIRRKLG